jgi:A/G-specific adenine glycosylase
VLVSEVMAQQTQVSRVDPAWSAFLAAFPTPATLAATTPGNAVRAWAGLGYNRRAVYLHRAARQMVERYDGTVPRRIEQLDGLPGVGRYTARAVAAIAFGLPVAPVDTNIARVLGRLTVGRGHRNDPGADRAALPSRLDLEVVGDRLIEPSDPAGWTHALMDLGATVCRPSPRCGVCPLQRWCRFAKADAPRSSETLRNSESPRSSESRNGTTVPFERTSRWLRGQIVAHLRESPTDAWVRLDGPIGLHPAEAVREATRALERDGIVEVGPNGLVRLPSG